MCFLTNTWTTKSWSIQLYDQNKSLRNQLYEQTLDKTILNNPYFLWPDGESECQRIQSIRNRIRENPVWGTWKFSEFKCMVGLFKPSLTLGASKFSNSNPRVQNMRTEWKTTKYQQSENNEKKWNQVLKLASKTRKAKSQMDPFQNSGKTWNQVLKLASKTRKAKSQMDPFQNLGKPWNPALKLASKTRKAKSQMDP